METISFLISGFQTALSFENIGAAALGAILGIIVGAMPGIGSLVGVALLLPLTYAFNPTTAIIMLGAIYYANMFGGAFSSILINVPGDAPAIMTALDGYPLARKGYSARKRKAGKSAHGIEYGVFRRRSAGYDRSDLLRSGPRGFRSEIWSCRDDHADAGGIELHKLAY